MKTVNAMILSVLVLSTTLLAQPTIIKLPTTDNTSSFNVTKSNDDIILKMNADGGFYAGGIFLGSIPVEGTGQRIMWYNGKGAFRAGYAQGTTWNDLNIGIYSTAFGIGTTASGNTSTAMGTGTIASALSSTAMGEGAQATENVSTAMGFYSTASGFYSTAMGNHTTASGSASIATGSFTTASGFISTAMGHSTTASGWYSTAMGSYVSTAGLEGSFVMGDHSTTTVISPNAANQLTMRFAGGYNLFTNPGCTAGLWLGGDASSWSTYSDSTKKENFVRADGEYFLSSLAKLRLGSWNYKVQDPKVFRHYGPMAQEIFHYFGKDEFGVIGNDTSLATADMDGIMMICLQALEKRTSELKNAEKKIARLEKAMEDFNKKFFELEKVVYYRDKKENNSTLTVKR